ncbi:MAG: hypothetical protein LUG85_01630 [Clostridiales bacterium]|nr:hypothetical protein [Clostridiales bacterium]
MGVIQLPVYRPELNTIIRATLTGRSFSYSLAGYYDEFLQRKYGNKKIGTGAVCHPTDAARRQKLNLIKISRIGYAAVLLLLFWYDILIAVFDYKSEFARGRQWI